MVKPQQQIRIAMLGWFKFVTKVTFLLALLLFVAGKTFAQVSSSSTDLDEFTQNWEAGVHVAAKSCGAVFVPSPNWNQEAGEILVYYDYNSFQAASGIFLRTSHCVFDAVAKRLYVFCPAGTQPVIIANPKLAASVFNLRGFTAWVSDTSPYKVYGYYCSSSGCYGNSDGSVTLDGAATEDSFQTEVKVFCVK